MRTFVYGCVMTIWLWVIWFTYILDKRILPDLKAIRNNAGFLYTEIIYNRGKNLKISGFAPHYYLPFPDSSQTLNSEGK